MSDPRRYTDQEFALILRRALELEERAPAGGGVEGGLTLEQMQAVAREVGVDPELVARAAQLLPHRRRGAGDRLLGGPTHASTRYRSPRTLADEDVGRVVSAIRSALATQGAVEEELDAVTWKSVGSTTQLFVTLRPHDGGTEVELRMDRSGSAVIVWFLSVMAFLFVAGALGNTLAPDGILDGLLYLLAFLSGGLASARTLWWRLTQSADARFQELLEVVAREVDASRELPAPSAPSTVEGEAAP